LGDTNEAVQAVYDTLPIEVKASVTPCQSRGGTWTVLLPPGEAVLASILCNDGNWNRDPNVAVEEGNKANEKYPLIGGNLTSFPCTFWNKATTSMPETPKNVPPCSWSKPSLTPATNTSGALNAFERVPNARWCLSMMKNSTVFFRTALLV
jgi:hypothetical protein